MHAKEKYICSSSSSRRADGDRQHREQEGTKERSITLEKHEHQYEVEETWPGCREKVRPRRENREEVKPQQRQNNIIMHVYVWDIQRNFMTIMGI